MKFGDMPAPGPDWPGVIDAVGLVIAIARQAPEVDDLAAAPLGGVEAVAGDAVSRHPSGVIDAESIAGDRARQAPR
jgi:hypothetical protein